MSPALDRIEADEFFGATYAASTHRVVALMLERSGEIKQLATSGAPSDRVLEDRAKVFMSRPGAQRMPLIAYAILLKLRGDVAAVPLLAQYLRAIPDSDASAALSPWDPFYYVVDAVCRITGAPGRDPGEAAFRARHSIADAAERWYAQRTAQRPNPRTCPKCHRTLDAGKKFCTGCGTRVGS